MRVLLEAQLLELSHTEAGPALAHLRAQGYQWLQERAHGSHTLWDCSGDVCVGEMWEGRLYLDLRVRPDLESFCSGYTEDTSCR